jgi:hypothetical protein
VLYCLQMFVLLLNLSAAAFEESAWSMSFVVARAVIKDRPASQNSLLEVQDKAASRFCMEHLRTFRDKKWSVAVTIV